MKILGFETSTEICSVGLVDDEGKEWSESVVEAHIHSEKILTITRRVLDRSRWSLGELNGIALSSGPGSFTGLRIGMSTAKGLCYALEIPLLVVPTFEAVARAVFEKHNSIHEVAILSDAKQGEYYLQRFKRTSGEPIPAGKARIVGRDEAMEGIPAHTSILFVIDRREIRRQIAEKGGACASLAEFMSGVPVAHLGLKKYLAKEFADVASAEPFYLKDFVVTSPARSHKVAG